MIMLANNESLAAEGVGEVQLNGHVSKIEKVLFVPNLSANLISVSRLCDKGHIVVFDKDSCKIYKTCEIHGNPITSAPNVKGLYKWNGSSLRDTSNEHEHSILLCDGRQEAVSASVAVAAELPADLWHKRLGHLGMKGMCALRDNLATGICFQVSSDVKCETCLLGKQVALPFPAGEAARATSPLELIHSDVAGPMQECSFGGAKYIVTFTDDYTRKTYAYLMKNKSEVMHHFITFKNEVEKQLGLSIKILRSDNGSEYCNSKFVDFLRKEGIIHQTSVPYCPQQNGVSERLNRTLLEKARCLLIGAGLCTRFWGEAVMTAVYLKNRCPTAALAGRTPEEVWTGSRPDLSHLHVFGCVAYALCPKQKRRKLDARSKAYIFVGYSTTTKGYRLMDPMNPHNVIVSRNVVFLENKFYRGLKEIIFDKLDENRDLFYEFDISCNDNLNIESCDNISNNNSSQSIINNDNLNNFNSNEMTNNLNNDNEMSIENSNHNTMAFSDDEEFCTGSEDEEDCAASGSADSLCERVEVSQQPSPSGVDVPAPSASVSHSSRPVRSTRSKPPLRYADFDTDFSMVARDASVVEHKEPETYNEAVSGPESDKWIAAMSSEYNSLLGNNVWKLVDRPRNRNVVKCKWVFKKKLDASGHFDKYKARLVAMGFSQVHGIDYRETFSPVVRHSTMRILFALSCELDLKIEHLDITTAFLNGELQETIYMEQPPGFENGDKSKVCLLQKGIYGLKQASRIWYEKVNKLLCENGFCKSKCEPCIYIHKTENSLMIVALYVDDFYVFYNNELHKNKLFKLLTKEFDCKQLGTLKNCLGINVTREGNTLRLDQKDYIRKLLKRFGMEQCKPVSTPMAVNFKFENDIDLSSNDTYSYRELMGCLMYLSVCTRPDIAFACSQLSQYNVNFNKSHWIAAKRILRYLAGTINYALCFVKSRELNLTAFADADWANDPIDRRSYTGFVIKLGSNTVNWESRKQRCVALSSTEAEYLSINDACKDLCFIKNFLFEVISKSLNITVLNDNQSAHKLLQAKEYSHKRTKHIDVRYHYIKDLIQNNVITVKYLPTECMTADVLTKPLSSSKHHTFIHNMNLM